MEDVESFDETGVVIYTSKGTQIVLGSSLHIAKLASTAGN